MSAASINGGAAAPSGEKLHLLTNTLGFGDVFGGQICRTDKVDLQGVTSCGLFTPFEPAGTSFPRRHGFVAVRESCAWPLGVRSPMGSRSNLGIGRRGFTMSPLAACPGREDGASSPVHPDGFGWPPRADYQRRRLLARTH